ncbi:Methyltransferase type 11 [uncultured Caudovirales phage]|uniref:Methyltransferase type 11 n=1 Tax=uncultured Caudovirales phage TaxID=2100421 RepID=A0A6J7WNK8_9CAUD|nr:Methyltransferase type 11 [uncultured Caudovirales phage]
MNFNDWFNFGQSRKFIEINPNPDECSFGYEIDYPLEIKNVDVYDEKYLDLRSVKKFIKMGINNGWIKNEGCMKHELKNQFVKLTDGRSLESFDKGHVGICVDDSSPEVVNFLINEAKKISDSNLFFDIGVGEGIPVSIAAKKYKYTGGIDIDPELVKISKEKVPNSNITIEDAFNLTLEDKKSHIYMFNPFDNYILEAFLTNNNAIIKKNGSLILYHNNYQADHLLKLFGYTPLLKNVGGLNIYQLK